MYRLCRHILFFLVSFVFFANRLPAQWTQIGSLNYTMKAMAVFNDTLFIMGNNLNVNGQASPWFCSYSNTNGFSYNPNSFGGVGIIDAVIFQGKLYAAGEMGSFGLGFWNGQGWEADTGYHVPGNPVNNRATALYTDGNDLYIGDHMGYLHKKSGVDGSFSLVDQMPMNSGIYAICKYNGKLFIGGNFMSHVGSSVQHLFRIAQYDDSLKWQPVGWGASSEVYCMQVYNGELYVGGYFNSVANQATGIQADALAKWNGTMWSSVPYAFGASWVKEMKIIDGELFVVGSFHHNPSVNAFAIVKFNGVQWNHLNYFDYNDDIETVEKYHGEIYVTTTNAACQPSADSSKIMKLSNATFISDPGTLILQNLVYPNPSQGNLFINFEGLVQGPVVVNIFDLSGRIIFKSEFNHDGSVKSSELITNGVCSIGIYFIEVQDKSQKYTSRIVIN
jgi:hypothetical protein